MAGMFLWVCSNVYCALVYDKEAREGETETVYYCVQCGKPLRYRGEWEVN